MAFKLTKAEIKERDKFVEQLTIEGSNLANAISRYNEAHAALAQELQDAYDTYNGVVEEAQGFVSEIAESRRGEYDDKSERWKEGEAGELASEFVDAWEGISLEVVELDITIEQDQPEPSHRDDLEGLPEAAG